MASELADILKRRELIRNLVARQLKVRYKSSSLGFLWSMLSPFLMMLVYWFIFTRIMNPRGAGIPNFKAYILCGLFTWYFFAGALTDATTAIVGNVSLVKRIYFPRIILPISTTLTNLVNFLLSLIVLFILLVVWRSSGIVPPSPQLAFIPVVILIELALCLGFAFFLAPLNVLFRDIEHMLQVILLAWMFMTPAVYPYWDVVPGRFWMLYFANPMACLIAAYQRILWAGDVVAGGFPLEALLLIPACWAVVLLVSGYLFMRKVESSVVDQL